MQNFEEVIRNTFEYNSVRDAELLFQTCIKSAFPTFNFRRLELIRFSADPEYLEGRSWNHVFEITKTDLKGEPVWQVDCHRVTMGRTPDKQVYLDYLNLGFVSYKDS